MLINCVMSESSYSGESYSEESSSTEQEPDVIIDGLRNEGAWESFGNLPELYLSYFCKSNNVDSAFVAPNRTNDNTYLLVSSISDKKLSFSKVPVEFGRSERVLEGIFYHIPLYKMKQEYKLYKPIPATVSSVKYTYIVVTYKKKIGLIKKKWETKFKYFESFQHFKDWFKKVHTNTLKYKF